MHSEGFGMSKTRRHRASWSAAFAFLIVLGPATMIATACKKDEPPPPVNLPSDEDDKPKKKKKSTDDEDPAPIDPTAGGDGADAGKGTVGVGTGKKGDAGKGDNGKALLQACCTALHNAAAAAGVAKTAGSAIPGLPPPPPEDELKKQAAACDKAVVEFSGDLNKSLKTIKGASPIALPAACNIG
jgi:hypothetical protein